MSEDLKSKVKKYRKLTEQALGKVKLVKGLKPEEKRIAADFLDMARNYFSDAGHFEKEGKLLTALAAYSYAHAWLDAGVRAGVFDAGKDGRLFALR